MFLTIMNAISTYAIPFVLFAIPIYGLAKKVKVYTVFCEGAKEGFSTAVMIIPYLVCMLCAIGMLRASGAMDAFSNLIGPLTEKVGVPVEMLPMGIMRSFSGGGAEGLMVDLFNTYGVDSLIGRMASVAMGSTETTFYCIAVYFGAVGVSNVRHAVVAGLLADLASFVAACVLCNILWG